MYTGISAALAQDGGCMLLLEGVAGSGKTYTVSRILETYLVNNWSHHVAFAATTNRAVKVAYKSTEFNHINLEFATIHKLLALKEVILPDGTIDFYPDKFIQPGIVNCKVVFIDESSQFSKKLWGYLLPHIDNGVKVIFIGDPFQTPPVKETDSLVFNAKVQADNNMRVFRLTEIIRQAAENPIIGITTLIRDNITHPSFRFGAAESELWQGDKGAYFLSRGEDSEYFDTLLKHMFTSSNFHDDAVFAKVVAWRNKTVNALNKGIRRMIYGKGKLRRIEPGEKLVTKAPVFDKVMDFVCINNAEDIEVISLDRQQETINGGQFVLPYYDTKVRFYDMFGTERTERINIPTDIGMQVLNEVLELMAAQAKSYQKGSYQASGLWKEFYNFKKAFADISYAYAGTVHTSQGGTFDNVVVMNCDIGCNPKVVERNKILYTACSRPSERLFII